MKRKFVSILVTAALLLSSITTIVHAENFSLHSSKMLSPSDLAAHSNVTFDGKSVVEFNTSGKTAAVRYDNLGMSSSYASQNRYLLIDVYYKKSTSVTTPFGMSVTYRSTNGSGGGDNWGTINKQSDSIKKQSSGLTAFPNRWSTVAIDCQPALNYLSTNNLTLKQLQIEIPATSGDDRVYIGDVRFSDKTGNFEFGKTATILSGNDLMSSPLIVNFEGKTDVQKFTVSSTAHTVRYDKFYMGHAYAASNKYLLVDCYLENANIDTFTVNTQFRQVYNGVWINNNTSITTSSAYPTNKWVTVAIECQNALSYLSTNKYVLTQSQIQLSATDGNFYIDRVRYADAEIEREVHIGENERFVYLSEDGYVIVDNCMVGAFKNTTDAFKALGAQGGTVYLEGNLTAFADVANGTRGSVLFRGLGDSASDIANNVLYKINSVEIKGGDITFDYLTVDPYQAETNAKYTSFFTCQTNAAPIKHITIGEHMVSTGMALGIRKGTEELFPNRDVFTINGGTYYAITPLLNYGTTKLHRLGSVDWIINGGTIHNLYAGSNNSWENEESQIRGDVKYTINGGIFEDRMIMGSAYGSTEIQGNVIWTINGGLMSHKRIVGGNVNAKATNKTAKQLKNVAAIVNLKDGKEGLSTLTLGSDNAKGTGINENEIYILNNYEDNLGTKIADGSLADYKMHVYYGQAEPVFANNQTTTVNGATEYFGGSLVGFRMTADETGAVPYLKGVALTPDSQGVYTIPADTANIIEVIFVKDKLCDDIYFRNINGTVSADVYNVATTVAPVRLFIAEYLIHPNDVEELTDYIIIKEDVDVSHIYHLESAYTKKPGYVYRAFLWNDTSPLAQRIDL